MRALAARLGVVPGALYRHVRSKEQLCDLVVDGVLAEVDTRAGRARRHRRAAQDPRSPRAALPGPGRGLPRPAAASRPARPGHRAGLLPDLRLHPRLRAHRPHHRQRAARPGLRDPPPAVRISSGHCQPTVSPPSPPSASTSGRATATSDSPPASTPSSAGSRPRNPGRAVSQHPDHYQPTAGGQATSADRW